MEDIKRGAREIEDKAKEAGREVDGHDLGDDVGNAGDDIRTGLGNAGDAVRRTTDAAADRVGDAVDSHR